MEITLSCGEQDHDTLCLCDVRIETPVEIRYGFTDVWGADVVSSAKGYREGVGGADLADYLEALAMGYDATRRLADVDDDWLDGVRDPANKSQLRALLSEGVSIVEVPDGIGDSFARVVAALTDGQPSIVWTWEEAQWAEFEDYIARHDSHSPHAVAAMFGVGRSLAGTLIVMYGKSAQSEQRGQLREIVERLFDEMPAATAAEILEAVRAEGHNLHLDALRKMRQRWKKRQPAA